MRIGIFGGAFNPVHNGHLNLADIYYKELRLDKLIFIPTAKPPHKSDNDLISGEDRVNMLTLAIGDRPYEISSIEFDRCEKSYTYDTVIELKKLYFDDELFLIIGADQFLTFNYWYRYKELLSMVTLCTSARENEDEKNALCKFAKELGVADNYYVSSAPVMRVSSSEIRDKIKNKEDVSSLLPQNVLNYITEKGFYCV